MAIIMGAQFVMINEMGQCGRMKKISGEWNICDSARHALTDPCSFVVEAGLERNIEAWRGFV